jgi:dUTP pyrophosphatase
MPRYFEKISYEQFNKDVNENETVYREYILPKRSTKYSAGYDFFALTDFSLLPGEMKKIATGIKVNMEKDDVLMLYVRSSMGFKYNVRMCNQVGIIDSDYYNNSVNEGHIWVKLQNEGQKEYIVKKGDAICQGIFTKYFIVDNEELIENERVDGIGSTSKEN